MAPFLIILILRKERHVLICQPDNIFKRLRVIFAGIYILRMEDVRVEVPQDGRQRNRVEFVRVCVCTCVGGGFATNIVCSDSHLRFS